MRRLFGITVSHALEGRFRGTWSANTQDCNTIFLNSYFSYHWDRQCRIHKILADQGTTVGFSHTEKRTTESLEKYIEVPALAPREDELLFFITVKIRSRVEKANCSWRGGERQPARNTCSSAKLRQPARENIYQELLLGGRSGAGGVMSSMTTWSREYQRGFVIYLCCCFTCKRKERERVREGGERGQEASGESRLGIDARRKKDRERKRQRET